MTKNSQRNEMLTKLKNIDRQKYDQLSSKIKNLLISSDVFSGAQTIGLTMSRFPEVNTRPIIEAAWSMGKKVAVPLCINQTREMDFRLITSFDDLECGYVDLLEPIVTKTKSIMKNEIDLQVVPGVLYSVEGYRVGFGGGYYDRYLKNFNGHTISLAFECQTARTVPVERHDIPVQSIITEEGIHHCEKNEGYG